MPSSVLVRELRTGGATALTIPGLILSSTIANNYVAGNVDGASSTVTPALSNLNKTVTVTLGTLTPIGARGQDRQRPQVTIVPAPSLTDAAGNPAAATSTHRHPAVLVAADGTTGNGALSAARRSPGARRSRRGSRMRSPAARAR